MAISPWEYRTSTTDDEPWHYSMDQFQLSSPLASPPLSPEGMPLAEYASFLPMMDSFKLEDDLLTARSKKKRIVVPISLERQHSVGELPHPLSSSPPPNHSVPLLFSHPFYKTVYSERVLPPCSLRAPPTSVQSSRTWWRAPLQRWTERLTASSHLPQPPPGSPPAARHHHLLRRQHPRPRPRRFAPVGFWVNGRAQTSRWLRRMGLEVWGPSLKVKHSLCLR